MRIGLITDTHLPALIRSMDDLGPQTALLMRTVDLILHGGDVTSPSVIDWLEQFAPVVVAKGNNDGFEDPRMQHVQFLEVEGWRIGMIHNMAPERRSIEELRHRCFKDEPVDILIGGHTHLERLEWRDQAAVINSGSPILPHHKDTRHGTLGVLDLSPGRLHAEIVLLPDTDGRPNPATPMTMEVRDNELIRLVHGHGHGAIHVHVGEAAGG